MPNTNRTQALLRVLKSHRMHTARARGRNVLVQKTRGTQAGTALQHQEPWCHQNRWAEP